MSIEVRNLTKIYANQKAIDAISFRVNKGEVVGFLGPNGAGKSTTMKVLTGYLRQDGGEAEICGVDVQRHPLETKRKIGYLPEANPLYYDMFVKEYLDFVAGLHRLENKKNRITKVIGTVGLTPESTKKIGQLSKGYKQRVGLAAALIHDPEVLILDEPTSGLDPNQIVEIRDVIKQLGQDKTILFSSHILQEVEAICDRAIIIHKGVLVADNQLSNLKQQDQGKVVRIAFAEQVDADRLLQLAGVTRVKQMPNYQWDLVCTDPALVKKQLLELALQNNLNIVSLQNESQSLEDVFRTLTQGSAEMD
jgi:ABC-2 type transport system ATP-binding protein